MGSLVLYGGEGRWKQLHLVVAVMAMIAFRTDVSSGGYLHDVEFIEPITKNGGSPSHPLHPPSSVFYYPSYVKGTDPVEEFNRRRLHVDTSDYVSAVRPPNPGDGSTELDISSNAFKRKSAKRHKSRNSIAMSDESSEEVRSPKGKRYSNSPKRGGAKPRRKYHNVKTKDPIKRRWAMQNDSHELSEQDDNTEEDTKRYEESDPNVFTYERRDPLLEGEVDPESENERRQQPSQEASMFFQDLYCEQKSPHELEFGHLYETDDGWEERYERQDRKDHRYQGKVF